MTAEELVLAASEQLLAVIEEVDPSTAVFDRGYTAISGRAPLPLNAVSWSFDRTDDRPVNDEFGSNLGTLCLVRERGPIRIADMTRWQYTAYLVDCDQRNIGVESHQFSRDYLVVEQDALERYVTHYMVGSALWGGFSHGLAQLEEAGWKTEVSAIPDLITPTTLHEQTFALVAQPTGPREQFLKLYHTIELLFDFVTFRRIVKGGDDLVGFGKAMSAYQRGELDKVKSIIKDFCFDVEKLSTRILRVSPYMERAEEIFQVHGKDGNPLQNGDRWEKFRMLTEFGIMI